jgi:hypothetical protein
MMKGGRVLIAQFVAVLILAVATWLAVWHFLYWRLFWLDIPMHVLGGVWAALCAAWIMARRGEPFSLAWCLSFAFVVGIGWEIFEYMEGIAYPRYMSYTADTTKDIIMDLVGALLGWSLATKLWMMEVKRG